MRYLICNLLMIISINSTLASDTIVIKKYHRPSKSLLDKKIVIMDMGNIPSSHSKTTPHTLNQLVPTQTKISNNSSSKQKNFSVKKIQTKDFTINKIVKKPKLDSLVNNTQGDLGSYKEEDWEDYIEYQEVECEESLEVSAEIKKK